MRIETFDQFQKEVDNITDFPNDNDGVKLLFFKLIKASGDIADHLAESILHGHKVIQEDKDKIAWACSEVMMYLSQILTIWHIPLSRFILNNDIKNFGMKLRVEPAIVYRYGTRLSFTCSQFANTNISGFMLPDIKKGMTGTILILLCTVMIALGIDLNNAFSDFLTRFKKEAKNAENSSEETTKSETGESKESGTGSNPESGFSGTDGKPSDSGDDNPTGTGTDTEPRGEVNGQDGQSEETKTDRNSIRNVKIRKNSSNGNRSGNRSNTKSNNKQKPGSKRKSKPKKDTGTNREASVSENTIS